MFRRVIFLLFFIVSISYVYAQDTPVMMNMSWTQAGMKAIDEKKLVFVAVGISPDNISMRKLFADEGVKSFLNRNAIGITMNMHSSEGESFQPKLLMYDWPIYAYFMPFGDLLVVVKPEDAYKEPSLLVSAGSKAVRLANIKRENSRSILFSEKELDWAVELGRVENKPVFLYGYKGNNQDALLMEKNVFNLDRVADFYNRHFICVKSSKLQSV